MSVIHNAAKLTVSISTLAGAFLALLRYCGPLVAYSVLGAALAVLLMYVTVMVYRFIAHMQETFVEITNTVGGLVITVNEVAHEVTGNGYMEAVFKDDSLRSKPIKRIVADLAVSQRELEARTRRIESKVGDGWQSVVGSE